MTQKIKVYTGRAATTVVMTFALLLCALCVYVLLGATSSIHKMVGDVHFSVEITDSTTLSNVQIEEKLSGIEGTHSVVIHEGESAQAGYSKFVGIDLKSHLGGVHLPKVAVVTLSAESAKGGAMMEIKRGLAQEAWVQSVHFEESIPEQVTKNLGLIERFASYVAGIIGIAALVIVYLGIRLSVGAQFNGYSPSAYGALVSEAYRWAWVQGLISAASAVGLMYMVLKMAESALTELHFSMELLPIMAAGMVVVSTLSSLFFTMMAVTMQRSR